MFSMVNEQLTRIRLDLTEVNLHPFKYVWVPLVHRDLRTIKDFKETLCQRFNFDKHKIVKLFVQDSLLLDDDSVFLLRENDTVKVVYEDIPLDQNDEDLTSSSSSKKKKRKRTYDMLESKETNHLSFSKSMEISELNTLNNNSLSHTYEGECNLISAPSNSKVSKKKFKADVGHSGSLNFSETVTKIKKSSSDKCKATNDVSNVSKNRHKKNLEGSSDSSDTAVEKNRQPNEKIKEIKVCAPENGCKTVESLKIKVLKNEDKKDLDESSDSSDTVVQQMKQINKKSSDTKNNRNYVEETDCKPVITENSLEVNKDTEPNKNCEKTNSSFFNETDFPNESQFQFEPLSLDNYNDKHAKKQNSSIDNQSNPDSKVETITNNILKKRKRKRKRKSNKKVELTDTIGSQKEQEQLSKPNSFYPELISNYDPNIRKHIIFTDNDCKIDSVTKNTKVIPLNSYLKQFNSSIETSNPPISSENNNLSDFKMMSTPKNNTGNTLNSWNMTSLIKEPNDESTFTNSEDYSHSENKQHMDHIMTTKETNETETNGFIHSKSEQSREVDYTKLPSLKKLPEKGFRIAYKLLELSDLYCPEISEYKEGVVTDVNSKTGEMVIELVKEEIECKTGKFELLYPDEMPDPVVIKNVKVCWSSLIEPKIVGNM